MTLRNPKLNFSMHPASTGVQNSAQAVLFVGQKGSAGTATSGVLYENIGNDQSWDTLFAPESPLAAGIRAFKKINKISKVDAIPLADSGSGVAASGSILFTSPATAGTITVTIGSIENYTYSLAVTASEAAADIVTALVALINADTKCPVNAEASTATLNLTAHNKGTEGNFISIKVSATMTYTATITGMTSGATNPTLTGLFDVIVGKRYQTIVYPSSFSLTPLTDLLNSRFNVSNNILDGVGIISVTDTLANLKTLGNTHNKPYLVIHGNKKVSRTALVGSALTEIDYVISSQLAAIRALRLTEDADLSLYVTSTQGALDNYGGMHIASLPYFNTAVYDLPIVEYVDEWKNDESSVEVDELLAAGVFVIGNNTTRTETILGQVCTTYKTDTIGNTDNSYKYLEYVDTFSNIREYFYLNIKRKYAQSRLTDGDPVKGFSMVNAAMISAEFDALYADLANKYVLTVAGDAAQSYFSKNKTVSVNMETGTVTVTLLVPIVTQLRQMNVSMQLSFNFNS